MFKALKSCFIFSLTFLNTSLSSQNINFSYPTSTLLGSPNLGLQGESTQITTNSTGQYVYAIWDNPIGVGEVIVAVSTDFGATWPTSTVIATNIGTGRKTQITTDSSGKYVYAIWNNASNVQVAISSDFAQTWSNPQSTPISTPNLGAGERAQITINSTGKYVYASWNVSPGAVQTAFSSDFGLNWSYPISTPKGSPDLATSGEFSEITTSDTGEFVYAIWNVPTSDDIQVAVSSDFGLNWSDPTSTPISSPNLSTFGEFSQITTNNTGKFVYAIWNDPSGNAVQVAISSDFAQTWSNPTSTPTGTLPNLAAGLFAQITTDNSGKYVHAIWHVPPGNAQVATSLDFGLTWSYPLSTPSNTATPTIGVGVDAQITTDISGRYIYAAWNNLATGFIQAVLSTDFGLNWSNPTAVPIGTIPPNLAMGVNAQIAMDNSGKYIYVIWNNTEVPTIVQTAKAFKTFYPLNNLTIKRN
ncbi:MAG: hypothetical protein KR126chlam5_00033 [Candidatus Anoxychlamydiales bacterium]|nr:hypothetical protein [Candidatus Anoxychlamydiales bacterium]NGX51750.1 hypothetical protein [Candidatus Anoxychlamydiales bacterium]